MRRTTYAAGMRRFAHGVDGFEPDELIDHCARANVKSVQRTLCHKSATMTLDTYSGLFEDDLDAVAQALNAAGEAFLKSS